MNLGAEEPVNVSGATNARYGDGSTSAGASEPISQPAPRMILRPRTGWGTIGFRELWEFRDLLWILALRDVQIRYKQTALGILWALLQPIATVAVFTVVVGRAMGVEQR
ncbi:MAG: hypothetical protein ACREQY_10700, partial [Candidatus Binatia bacterium]